MKKNLWLVFVLAILISGLSACKGGLGSANLGETAATAVPEDAAAVVSINLKSLMDKADMKSVKKMEFYKDMVAEAARQQGETMAKILENPETSGIDLTKNAYFFAEMNPGKEKGLVGFTFSIADEGDFETLVQESDMDVEKGSSFQFAKGNGNIVAWNNTIGFVGSSSNSYGSNDEEVQRQLIKLFSGKNSITENAKASKALGGNHDVNYYFSTETVVEMFEDELQAGELFDIKISDLKNNSFSGYTDFNKGEIVTKGNAALAKNLQSDLKMIFGEGSDTDFSKYIAKDGLMMFMNGKLNFKGINQLLKDKNASGLINMQLNQVGLSSDDIAAAIDGDVAVALNSKKGTVEPTGLFALKIGKRAKLDEILGKGEILGLVQKIGDNMYTINGGMLDIPPGKIIIKDNILFFSNNMATLNKLEKGGFSRSERIDGDAYEAATGVLGMYMNYANVGNMMKGMSSMDMGYGNVESMVYSLNWDKSSSTVTMEDKSKNSLQALIEGLNDTYLKGNEMRKKYENEEEIDMDELMEKVEKMETIEM